LAQADFLSKKPKVDVHSGAMSNGFRVLRSSIHGRGLFATRRFLSGELIGLYEGEPSSRDGRYVLWVVEDDGTEVGVKGSNALRFVNHSPTPNCAFHGIELRAIKPIRLDMKSLATTERIGAEL
jgi:hypothetical protein